MKQILFTTAYSAQSKVAYRYAQRVAQHFGAGITLCHVYNSPTPILATNASLMNEMESNDIEQWSETQWEREFEKIKAFAEELNGEQFMDIPLDYIVTDGDVVVELLKIQEENNFDLIIMGTRKHNLGERFFGNTTYQMIDEADCPLLLIPPEAHYMSIDKIIYGTAFEFGDMKAINKMLEWCDAFFAKLHVLHVTQSETKQEASEKMAQLKEHFQEENEDDKMTFQLLEGKVPEVMEKYIQLTSADILAIHRRKQGFWQRIKEGSLTKVLTEKVKVPILVLK